MKNIIEVYNAEEVQKIIKMLEKGSNVCLLDCGCGLGDLTSKIARRTGANNAYGVEINKSATKKAKTNGVNVVLADLNRGLPFKGDLFDVVISIEMIMYLHDIDNFIEEIHRVLKHGGYLIISVQNLSSWHNIFALVQGYQAFPQQISYRRRIGNPFYPDYQKKTRVYMERNGIRFGGQSTFFTYQGLKEILELYGYEIKELTGSGYLPFTGRLSSILSALDIKHSYWLIAKAAK